MNSIKLDELKRPALLLSKLTPKELAKLNVFKIPPSALSSSNTYVIFAK
jgi:hypothetical protein